MRHIGLAQGLFVALHDIVGRDLFAAIGTDLFIPDTSLVFSVELVVMDIVILCCRIETNRNGHKPE